MSEAERIKQTYIERDRSIPENLDYSYLNRGFFYLIQYREQKILEAMRQANIHNIKELKILDIGCGDGSVLSRFVHYGVNPNNLYGIDLASHRIEMAKNNYPNIHFRISSAEKVEHPDRTFDMILQFTCFSSILDGKVRKRIADEMLRVLKPRGVILWYDLKPISYFMNAGFKLFYRLKGVNVLQQKKEKRSTPVEGITENQIKQLFSNCTVEMDNGGLYLSIAKVASKGRFIFHGLIKFSFLNNLYFARIKPCQ